MNRFLTFVLALSFVMDAGADGELTLPPGASSLVKVTACNAYAASPWHPCVVDDQNKIWKLNSNFQDVSGWVPLESYYRYDGALPRN